MCPNFGQKLSKISRTIFLLVTLEYIVYFSFILRQVIYVSSLLILRFMDFNQFHLILLEVKGLKLYPFKSVSHQQLYISIFLL